MVTGRLHMSVNIPDSDIDTFFVVHKWNNGKSLQCTVLRIQSMRQGLNANAPISIMIVINIFFGTICYNGCDFHNVVGHHMLWRGGDPINAVRALVLQLYTVKETC
jgi:hypothetical protein